MGNTRPTMSPPSPQPKIRVENLIKIFGQNPKQALADFLAGNTSQSNQQSNHVFAVSDVSLSIQEGELFVIMGLSGSGKSTLIRCLNRLIEATSGQVYIDGEDISQMPPAQLRQVRRTKMSMVFQKFALLPHQTVLENVEYGLKICGMPLAERREKALVMLERVGLRKWAYYKPSSLSGGMQQRVGLARALATDADILLMDEAFSALDPLIRRSMQDELLRLQEELHKTIVFISHDIQEALRIGDRVAIMKDGRVEQVGTPEEIITRPANDYIEAFTQDVNRAQVLKTGSLVRKTIPFILGHGSVQNALEHMHAHHLHHMYVVDRHNQPTGFVTDKQLAKAISSGAEDINTVMTTDFPQVTGGTSLDEVFHLCQAGIPLAVVGQKGKFKGVVEQSDIFASIGRLNTGASDMISSEEEAVASSAISA